MVKSKIGKPPPIQGGEGEVGWGEVEQGGYKQDRETPPIQGGGGRGGEVVKSGIGRPLLIQGGGGEVG